jgi:DNA repair exonuclease SbcCD ATPase subunit
MARKIFSWILIILGSLFLILSVAGIFAVWIYNEPITEKVTTLLSDIDRELALAQATLESSEQELTRALRIVDASQAALEKLTQQTSSAETLFESIQSTLDDRLLPELKTTRLRIESARTALESLQSVLEGVGNFIPGVDLGIPTGVVADLITSANSLDTEIANVETLAQQASLFVSDTSYLLGGDLTETRESLQSFLTSIQDYQKKVTTWREQAADLAENAPKWIDQASIALTIFLLWFGLSQFGLILHGLNLLRGADPLLALRRTKIVVREDGVN